MMYDVLVAQIENDGYVARVLAWPDCEVKAASREDAIALARIAILKRLAKTEIVQIEIKPEDIENPWLKFAGMWADDPHFDDFVTEIERYRREIDVEQGFEMGEQA